MRLGQRAKPAAMRVSEWLLDRLIDLGVAAVMWLITRSAQREEME